MISWPQYFMYDTIRIEALEIHSKILLPVLPVGFSWFYPQCSIVENISSRGTEDSPLGTLPNTYYVSEMLG